jgi:ADP-ribose pyrophosphatase YjhB (NUDIX family)
LPNEDRVDVAVRELFEETSLIVIIDDFAQFSDNHVRVPLIASKHQLVYVYAAYVPVPYVTANLRTLVNVDQVVTVQSTINLDGTYVVLASIDIDGLSLTQSKTWLIKESQRKFDLLHLGYNAPWEAFRGVVISKRLFAHDDTSLPRHIFFFIRFTTANSSLVWMLIKGSIDKRCGETPTVLPLDLLSIFSSPPRSARPLVVMT